MHVNTVSQTKSKIVLATLWLFIAALFADGANVDDLIPGTVVAHSDEDNASQANSQLLRAVPDVLPIHSHSLPQPLPKQKTPQPKASLRIVYDQDSDSLAANSNLASEASTLFPHQEDFAICTRLHDEALHLKLCTLLI